MVGTINKTLVYIKKLMELIGVLERKNKNPEINVNLIRDNGSIQKKQKYLNNILILQNYAQIKYMQ